MSKWINADLMEKHYASMLLNPTPDVTQADKKKAQIILEALRMEKGIDLPMCGECKYRNIDRAEFSGMLPKIYCEMHCAYTDAYKFCPWGRKGEAWAWRSVGVKGASDDQP